jgi:DNA-binding transcriptional regulator of glucitol operon
MWALQFGVFWVQMASFESVADTITLARFGGTLFSVRLDGVCLVFPTMC